ncbi:MULTISPECIES: response regulator [unclassified Leptolyngbya]|uniref:response regulator n=1 Tax=unclassified Leptolyngbya TaxID=2650499 RepID=UPI0016828F46|nr:MULTISPECIES: response regulator [unclassified Leptolyngbya]MBD1909435.1 response regulator [Leptolyngbya sp. FACHB-8]MBD2155668.1 response regulator [Leptolyngbya sp. FACHB-16]
MHGNVLLIAEDNPDDRLLIERAWSCIPHIQLFLVEDGEELMNFLAHQGKYAQADVFPRPNLILLDLRMPRKNGFEVLKDLKTAPEWKSIPTVVVTTSDAATDIDRAYELGANSYIIKPQTIQEILELAEVLNHYWFSKACLPHSTRQSLKS